jgi:hypothetical protein
MGRMGVVMAVMLSGFSAMAAELRSDSRFEGRPVFREGFDRGYFVWRDGREWHVRWTTQGRALTFSGQVIAEGGEIDDVDRIDLERESRAVRTGSRPVLVRGPRGRLHYERRPTTAIVTRREDRVEKDDNDRVVRFHARTDADIDGFDFTVDDDVRSLRFVLEIDGQTRAVDVEVGRENSRPGGNPFTVMLR